MSYLNQHWYDIENGDYVNPVNKPNDGKSLYSGKAWYDMTIAQKFASCVIIPAIIFFTIVTNFTGKSFVSGSLFFII